jgi:hypothetical protein
MKDLFAENFENFWKNVVFAKDFGNFCFPKNIVDLPPPQPWSTPPQSETGWHGPVYNGYFDFSIPTGIC